MISIRGSTRALARWCMALALGFPAFAAQGQAGAPAPAPAPAPAAAPRPGCGAKPAHPGAQATDGAKWQWQKDANAYLECYKKFAMDQRALAQRYQDAANAVIDEYNAVTAEMKAAADAAAKSD